MLGKVSQPSHPTEPPLVIDDPQGAAVALPAPEDEVEVRGRCSPREAPREQPRIAVVYEFQGQFLGRGDTPLKHCRAPTGISQGLTREPISVQASPAARVEDRTEVSPVGHQDRGLQAPDLARLAQGGWALQEALERGGVMFLNEEGGLEPGVRLAQPAD